MGFSTPDFFMFSKEIRKKLNPISRGHGSLWPGHHTFVCSFHMSRARINEIGDFVSLTIWLVPKKPFLKFLLQNFWKIWILNFLGSSSISRKLKILTKKIIFCRDSHSFLLNPYYTCSQLSFEVYNSFVAQNWSFDVFWLEKYQFWL